MLRVEAEEEEHKQKLKLYVFVAKCIAYHFNAKQPTDMARRQLKVIFLSNYENFALAKLCGRTQGYHGTKYVYIYMCKSYSVFRSRGKNFQELMIVFGLFW